MNIPEKNHRLLLEKLGIEKESLTLNNDIIIEKSAKGEPTVKIGDSYIHSKYDPAGEARKVITAALSPQPAHSAVQNETFDCWVFGGFGLGYYIESFLDSNDDAKIIIVEPEISLLAAAAQVRDLEKIINSDRIYYVISAEPEVVSLILSNIQVEKVNYFQMISEYNMNPEYFDKVKKNISAYISRKEINNNTLRRFGKLWVKNLSQNLAQFTLFPGLIDAQNVFANIPALIVAGGPSLDAIFPYFKQLARRYLIVAVDTSFNASVAAGVIPDILIVIDPQYWNSRHLDRSSEYDSILISEPSTYSKVFRIFKNYKYFSGSVFPLGQYFEDATFPRGKIGAGGSVATSAWDFARQAGCSEVLFIGLDLGYPDKKTHFKGSFFEERSHTLSNRLCPASNMDFSLITDATLIETESYTGAVVFTDKRLEIYRQWFEEQLNIHSLKTMNLSQNGVKIKNMEVIELKTALEKPDIRALIDARIDSIKNFIDEYKKGKGMEAFLKTEEVLNNLYILLENLIKVVTEAKKSSELLLNHCKGIKTLEPDYVQALLGNLDKADADILSQSSRTIAGFLLQDTIRAITRGNTEKTFSAIIEKSHKIYLELEESIKLHRKYINSAKVLLRKQT
ncbi:MAG: DUF115 domain-containing protein [Spirochaetes bacterium]|nr:DUF115 domain-containing protein [Spirochaetota bacterium]